MNALFTNQMVRECKGAAMSIVVLLILNPGGCSNEFLERYSGYTDKPVAQALAYLQETGRVVHTRAGWSLTAGIQLPLVFDDQPALQAVNSDTTCPSRNNSDSIDTVVVVKDLVINQETTTTDLSVAEVGKIPTLTMAAVLVQTSLLWDDPVTSQGLPERNARTVLAWVAQAWDQRSKLEKPQGFAYQAIKRGLRPVKKYAEHPERYLPEAYLDALGMEKPAAQELLEDGMRGNTVSAKVAAFIGGA